MPRPRAKPQFANTQTSSGPNGRWIGSLVIVVATFLAFGPALWQGFVDWDDPDNFLDNQNYRGLGWSNLRWMFQTFHLGPYQPLSWLTLAIDHSLWGLDGRGYHLTSLIFHALAALAMQRVSRRLLDAADPGWMSASRRELAASLAALLFAIHPLRVESVAWATERRDVLSGLFFLLTLLCYLRYAAGPPGRGRRDYALALGCYVLAALSKGMVMTLPVVLLLLDVYPLRRLGDRRSATGGSGAWIEKLPFAVIAAITAWLALHGQAVSDALTSTSSVGGLDRLALAGRAAGFYVVKTVLPIGLSPLYERPVPFEPHRAGYGAAAAIVAAVSAGLALMARRWPAMATAWAAYLVMLAPVSGLVRTGSHVAADRYTYLPCLGFALMGSAAIVRMRVGRAWLLAIMVCGGLGVLTFRQTRFWRDSETLWMRVLASDPTGWMANAHLGAARGRAGDLAAAEQHLRRAVTKAPADGDAWHNLGMALAGQGRANEAGEAFQRAETFSKRPAGSTYQLAQLHARGERVAEAIAAYRRIVDDAEYGRVARFNLATLYRFTGRDAEAVTEYRRVLSGLPDSPQVRDARRYVESYEASRPPSPAGGS